MRTLFLSSSSSSWPHPLDTATPSSLLPRRSLSRELLFHFGAFHTVRLSLRRLLDRPTVVHRSGAAGRQSVTSRWDGGQLPSTTSCSPAGRWDNDENLRHTQRPSRAYLFATKSAALPQPCCSPGGTIHKNNCSVGTTCTQLNRSRLSLADKISIMTNV